MSGIYENYLDQFIVPGTTYNFDFQVEPLDLTGATALMTVKALNLDGTDFTLAVTCTTETVGVNNIGVFAGVVAATTTVAWVPNPYAYDVKVTFSDGSVRSLVTGVFLVKANAVIS